MIPALGTGAASAATLVSGGAVHWFQLRSVGGAVADVAPDATAYAHRSANFSVVAMGSSVDRVDAAWADLESHMDGMYLSFDSRADVVTRAFPTATLERIREVKRRYDPDNVFHDNFAVEQALQG